MGEPLELAGRTLTLGDQSSSATQAPGRRPWGEQTCVQPPYGMYYSLQSPAGVGAWEQVSGTARVRGQMPASTSRSRDVV